MKTIHFVVVCSFILSATLLSVLAQVPPECYPTADVVFLLDGSDSISNSEFQQQLELMTRFVNGTSIGPDKVRVGFAVISSRVGDVFPLSLSINRDVVMAGIHNVTQPQEGSRTELGLVQMEQMFEFEGRPGVLRIGVIMTDGRAKFERATEVEAAVVKSSGIFLVAIGVGRLIKFPELEKIASTPSNAYRLIPLDLSSTLLSGTVEVLGRETCAGHGVALMDLLKTEANPNARQMTDVPVNALSDQIHQSATGVQSNVNPDIQAINSNPPQQTRVNVAATNSNPSQQTHVNVAATNLNPPQQTHVNVAATNLNPPQQTHVNVAATNLNPPQQTHVNVAATNLNPPQQTHVNVAATNLNPPQQTHVNVAATNLNPPQQTHVNVAATNLNPPQQTHVNVAATNLNPPQQTHVNVAATNLNPPQQTHVNVAATNFYPPQQTHVNVAATNFYPPQQTHVNVAATNLYPPQQTHVNVAATNLYPPQQTHVNGLSFLHNPAYNILNASVPQFRSHSAGNNILITTTTQATPMIVNSIVIDHRPFISNGLGINFDGGIADPNPVVESALPDNLFRPETPPTSGSGSNSGAPFQFSDRNIQVPVAREWIATNAVVDRQPLIPIINDNTTPPPLNELGWPKSSVPKDQCSKGRYVNGVRHTFVPNSCTDFVLCREHANGKIQMEVARCPFETFYDDKNAVCKYYEEITCWRDPCFNKYAESYTHPGNCRSYWSCSSGSSVPMCCPLGSSFARGVGCVQNTTCQDTCMDFGNIKMVIASTKCRLLPIQSNSQYFFEKVTGMGWMVRSCPPGSKFDHNICNCVTPDKVFKPSCRPELYLTFEEGVVDKSGNHLAMGNKNVRLDLGSGQFDGTAHLTMWRFSGVSFGQKVKITFRFRTSVWAPKGRLMHIVSNCCFGCEGLPQPSVDIAIIPGDNGGIAVFSASTSTSGENFVYVHFTDTFTGWNRLTYTYDGKTLTGTVNSASESKSIIGDIIGRPHPLMIGACGQTGAYQGLLDDFEFYMCTSL